MGQKAQNRFEGGLKGFKMDLNWSKWGKIVRNGSKVGVHGFQRVDMGSEWV